MLLFHLSYAKYSILGIFRRQKKTEIENRKGTFSKHGVLQVTNLRRIEKFLPKIYLTRRSQSTSTYRRSSKKALALFVRNISV